MSAVRHIGAAFWQQAAEIRDEWEAHGNACGTTDQAAAERAIGRLYRSIGRNRPQFIWVRSPREAQPLVAHLPTLDDLYRWVKEPPASGAPPLASDFAAAVGRLRGRLEEHIRPVWFDEKQSKKDKGKEWQHLPPEEALARNVAFTSVIRWYVREALLAKLRDGFFRPAKRMLGEPSPVCWYGQQEAHWIAYFDVWQRLGLVKYPAEVEAEFETWQSLALSAGWFWLDEDRCVISQKPISPRTFADGWTVA